MVTVWPATVSVPFRAAPVFAATVYVTLPFPVPELPLPIVIQFALLVAVHAHVEEVVTFRFVPLPPAAPIDALVGATVYEHDVAADSFTVTVCPAMVSVPARGVAPVFAATVNVTLPLPLLLAPAVTVTQFTLLAAVQVHPLVVVTLAEELVLPVAAIETVVGFTEYEQVGVVAVDAG